MSSDWTRIKAARESQDTRRQTAMAGALEAIRRRSYDGLGMPALPAVGPSVGDVRVLNPDGSLREIVSAEAFRARRAPTDEAERKMRRERRRGEEPRVERRPDAEDR